MTLDQFVDGYERSVEELPKVLNEWAGLDEELRIEYADQLEWLLVHRGEMLDRAREEGTFDDHGARILRANLKVFALRERIRDIMGVDPSTRCSSPPCSSVRGRR